MRRCATAVTAIFEAKFALAWLYPCALACTLWPMANRWVNVARWTVSAVVSSCVLTFWPPLVAYGQDADETSPQAPADTTEAPANSAAVGEPELGATVSPEPVDTSAAPVSVPTVAPQTAPEAQRESIPERLVNTLGGGEAVTPQAPVPPSNRDPRLDLLDTSFPAEQPEYEEPDPVPGALGNVRPTQARTANGITEISNRVDLPISDPPSVNRVVAPKPPLSRPQVNTEISEPRLESQVSLPSTSLRRDATGTSPWLWVLAGTAALLLIPIAFLLTRPTR